MTDNILKFKKKSRWELLGEINVDGGIIIISDAENFSKYFENEYGPIGDRKKHFPTLKDDFVIDLLEHDTCMKKGEYSGHSIPWLGGDGTFPMWGRFVERETNDSSQKSDFLNDIVIHVLSSLDIQINDFEKLDYTKCSIDIYSGKIGIDEPSKVDERGLVIPRYSYECPLGNGSYDIFEVNINTLSYSPSNNDSKIEEKIVKTPEVLRNKNYSMQLHDDLIRLCCCNDLNIRKYIFNHFNPEWLASNEYKEIFDKIYIHLKSQNDPAIDVIAEQIENKTTRQKFINLTFDLEKFKPSFKILIDCLVRLEQSILKNQIDTLREKLKGTDSLNNNIIEQLLKLEKDISNIKNKYDEQ